MAKEDFTELKHCLRAQDEISWHEEPDGIVCDHLDGGDYVVVRKAPEDAAVWVRAFLEMSRRRVSFINALHWWASDRGYRVVASKRGKTWYETDYGSARDVWLGRDLTDLMKSNDDAKVLLEYKMTHGFQIDPEEFERARSKGAFVANEAQITAAREKNADDFRPLVVALTAMNLGLASSGDFSEEPLAEETDPLIQKHPLILLALMLRRQFPEELDHRIKGGFKLQHEYSQPIRFKRAETERRIADTSVQDVFDWICSEYGKVKDSGERLRRRFLAHMAGLGYAMDEARFEGVGFGKDHTEFDCDLDALLSAGDSEARLNDWLKRHQLPAPLPVGHNVEIEVRTLPSRPPAAIPELADYGDYLGAIDHRSNELLSNHRKNGWKRPHAYWADPKWNQPELDDWATDNWWREQAIRHEDDLLLAVLGDAEARQRIIDEGVRLAGVDWSPGFCVYEGCNPVRILMAFPNAWPEGDRAEILEEQGSTEWWWTSYFEQIPYEFKRLAIGSIRDQLEAEEGISPAGVSGALRVFRKPEIERYLEPGEIAAIHDACLRMARCRIDDAVDLERLLETAVWFGWHDIIDALDENDTFWEAFRTWGLPISITGEVALLLSLVNRPHMVQRLAAWMLSVDKKAHRRELARRQLDEWLRLGSGLRTQKLAAAIAWNRVRYSSR